MKNTTLSNLRDIIDRLDDRIIAAIAERHEVSRQIGDYKKSCNIEVLDKDREQWLHNYHLELSQKYNISEEFVEAVFSLIVSQSRLIQNNKE